MVTSIIIIVLSAAMFVYWFRYTCLLILTAKTPADHSGEITRSHRMQFAKVRVALGEAGELETGKVQDLLNRDYKLIAHLARTANVQSVESAILKIDYRLMGVWCSLAGRVAPGQARRALLEMSSIIGYMTNLVGQSAPQNIR